MSAVFAIGCWLILIGFICRCAWRDAQDAAERSRARAEYFKCIDRFGRRP